MKADALTLHTDLVEAIHFLHAKGWAPATSSNYSVREAAGPSFWVSASGIDKGQFKASDLMRVDMGGRAIDDSRRPSAETLIHCYLYDADPGARCILHTHTVYNTLLSVAHAQAGSMLLEGYEVLKGIQGIKTHETSLSVPIFPNSQDMEEFTGWVREYHREHPEMKGFLIQGHGFYTWGATIAETKRHIEVFEFLFEIVYKLKLYQG